MPWHQDEAYSGHDKYESRDRSTIDREHLSRSASITIDLSLDLLLDKYESRDSSTIDREHLSHSASMTIDLSLDLLLLGLGMIVASGSALSAAEPSKPAQV
jgi:hypothetical protein